MAKKYAYWLDSGKYSMMQKLFVLVVGVFSFMMLTRMLTPYNLGVWGLFLIISGIIETARNAFIRNGYVLFMKTSEKEEFPAVEGAAYYNNLGFSIFFIIFFLATGKLIGSLLNAPEIATVLYCYSFSLIGLVFFSQSEIRLLAKFDFKGIFLLYFVRNGILGFVIAAAFFGGITLSLLQLSLIYMIAVASGALTSFWHERKHEKIAREWNLRVFKNFTSYGKFILGNNISSLVFRNTDSMLTSSYISAAASAFYSSCTRITNFADMPSQVLGDIMFPKVVQTMKSGNRGEIKKIYEKTVAATLTFTLPIVLIVVLFPKQILLLLAGSQYLEAAPILQIVILYGLFLPFIRQFGNVMDAMARPKINFMVMFIFAIVNICLNLIAISVFGILGSAIATLSSYILLFIVVYIILKKYLKISITMVLSNVWALYPEYFKMLSSSVLKYLKPANEK